VRETGFRGRSGVPRATKLELEKAAGACTLSRGGRKTLMSTVLLNALFGFGGFTYYSNLRGNPGYHLLMWVHAVRVARGEKQGLDTIIGYCTGKVHEDSILKDEQMK